MPPPVEVLRWLSKAYPKPQIAPKWLSECYEWVIETHGLSPANDLPSILDHIEMQFLNSDLRDSALPDTGLPTDIGTWQRNHLQGSGVLVEIISLTEIGHSAFSLLQARERRIESEGVVGLEDVDEALPKYPRGTLRFELTDGMITIPAIEYRPLPEFVLGETPLGYKMVLKNTVIRGGTAFLGPETVILKGGRNEDRDKNREYDFLRGLRLRLGLDPGPPLEDANENADNVQNVNNADNPNENPTSAPEAPPEAPRPPLSVQERVSPEDGDTGAPRRRKIPQKRDPSAAPTSTVVASAESPYFPTAASSSRSPVAPTLVGTNFVLSPIHRGAPQRVVVDLDRESGEDEGGSEFGDEIFMDEVFLEEVSRIERSAMSRHQSQRASSSMTAPRDVIVIEDSEQEEDGNVPILDRRVRRRTGDAVPPSQASSAEDVIEIMSDTD